MYSMYYLFALYLRRFTGYLLYNGVVLGVGSIWAKVAKTSYIFMRFCGSNGIVDENAYMGDIDSCGHWYDTYGIAEEKTSSHTGSALYDTGG